MKPFDPRLLRYAKGAGGYLAASALVALVQGLAIVVFAFFAGRAVAAVVMGTPLLEIQRDAVAAILAVTLRGLAMWFDRVLAARAAAGVRSELRGKALETIGGRGATVSSNDTATALGAGLDALDGYFGDFLPQLVRTIVITPIVVVALLAQDVFTGVAVILCLPLIPLFMVLIGMATQRVQRRQWEESKRLAGGFLEVLEGSATLKLFGRDRRATERIRATSDEHRVQTNRVLRVSFVSSMVLELAASLSIALVAVSIGVRLIDAEIALGVAFGLLILTPDAFLPIRQVGAAFHASTEGVVAVGDVLEIIEDPAPDAALPEKATASANRFVVDGVRDGKDLPPLYVDAPAGSLVAVSGASGVGKTKAIRALAGLSCGEGRASLRGRAVSRDDIAYAQQGSAEAVVTGTVRDNLAMGAEVSDTAMLRVLHALDVRVDLDAHLEPARGGQLGVSGGQAQRIALARAILRAEAGAQLLIADEPTSALDDRSEERVAAELRRLTTLGVTVVVVSHRETLLAIADETVRLEAVQA